MATADEVRRAMNRLIEHRASAGKRPGPYSCLDAIDDDKRILADAYLAAKTPPATPFDAEAFVRKVFVEGRVAASSGVMGLDSMEQRVLRLAAELTPHLRQQDDGERLAAIKKCWQAGVGQLDNEWRRKMARLVGDTEGLADWADEPAGDECEATK